MVKMVSAAPAWTEKPNEICGSAMFFDPVVPTDWTAVSMGSFDTPTGVHIEKHIFTADKGDYYDIADGVPQNEQ